MSTRLLLAALAAASAIAATPGTGRPPGDRVTITRDTLGVPHIDGETEQAAAFGFGYTMAEDHAAEIGRKYLAARGESARHFGPEFADRDLAMRRVRNREAARAAIRKVDPGFRRWLRAFADGINRFAAAHPDRVPHWMPIVEASDPLAYGRFNAINTALTPPAALLKKYPGAAKAGETPGTPGSRPVPGSASGSGLQSASKPGTEGEADEAGSNAFALAASRTTVGAPLLLGNPHLRWSERYWEAHVRVPGRIDFYGSTVVGIPLLRAGFNARIAYVQTNNAPDNEDIYALQLDPAKPDHYVLEGRSRPVIRFEASVAVRQPDGSLTTKTRTFASTHLGPVIHEAPGLVFAVRSVALESWRHYEGFYRLWRARSLKAFEGVLDLRLLHASNFTYADVNGNLLYRWNARLPKRADAGADYSLDVDPSDPRRRWDGLHPARDLPRLLNPAGGYIQNANNAPWWTSLHDRLDPARYPAYLEREPLSLRPQVVLEHLESRPNWSPEDVITAKYDTHALLAERVLPDLLAAIKLQPAASPDLREAAEVLAAWDRRVGADSRGAALFQRFWDRYREQRQVLFAEPWTATRPIETPRGLADPAAAANCLEVAAREVRSRHGRLDIAWGQLNRFRFGELDLPGDGSPGAPLGLYRVVGFDPQPDGRRVAGHLGTAWDGPKSPMAGTGDAWVLLVQLSRPVRAWSIVAYGQSSDLASPHSRDQIKAFAAHQLRPVWFTRAEVAANRERSYRPAAVKAGPAAPISR